MRQLRILLLPLLVHLHRGFENALRLFTVDVVLVGQALRGTAANILMTETSFHLIQHAFTQGAVREAQLFDRQRVKHAAEDRQPRYEHGFTFVGQTRQTQGVEALMLKHLFGEFHQALRRNKPVFFTHRQQHFMGRFNRPRCAQRHVPALNTVLPGQIFQFLYGGHARALEVFAGDDAAREIHLREADAAHTAAFHQTRLEVFANHQFRGATADINHQLAAFFRLRMLHAHKNQARFFVTGDDLNRVGDNLFRALKKFRRVQRLA